MIRYILFLIILSFIPAFLFAQESFSNEEKQSSSFRVNAYPLEFETEFPVNRTISIQGAVGIGYSFSEGIFDGHFLEDSDPYLQLFPRHYYNLDKRSDQGKNIAGFSGNYIGLYNVLHLKDLGDYDYFSNRNIFMSGPVWGLQRKVSDVAHLDLFAGWGAGWRFEDAFKGASFITAPIVGLKIGIYIK